jgi:vacuolar-type H+-ATPase catalytic subunit A/Vma1
MNTAWERGSDNTFNSTNIGKNFQQLKDDFNSAIKGEKSAEKSTLDLMNQIHSLDNQWRSCVSHCLDLLNQNKKIADEFNRSVENNSLDQDQHHEFLNKLEPRRLEEMLKFISLLEISHEFSKNLESKN